MALQRETIGKQVQRIQRLKKNRDPVTGMLFNTRRELATPRKVVTLVGLFVSDEQTFLIRPHVFEKKEGLNASQWNEWWREHYGGILPNILDGMENRTGKQWRLYRIIGWFPNDNSGIVRAKTRSTRNKTKSQRR